MVVDLRFCDFGDNLYAYPKDIFGLKDDFMGLKCQAVECFLAGVKPVNFESPKQWSQKCNDRFDEITYVAQFKQKLIAKIINFKPGPVPNQQIPGIELCDFNDGKNINVAQVLIAENLAEPSTSAYFGDLVKSSVLKMNDDSTAEPKTKEISAEPISLNLKLVTQKQLLEESKKEASDLALKIAKENNSQKADVLNDNFLMNESSKIPAPQFTTSDFLAGERQQNENQITKPKEVFDASLNRSENNGNDDINEQLVKAALQEGEKTVHQWSDLLKK